MFKKKYRLKGRLHYIAYSQEVAVSCRHNPSFFNQRSSTRENLIRKVHLPGLGVG